MLEPSTLSRMRRNGKRWVGELRLARGDRRQKVCTCCWERDWRALVGEEKRKVEEEEDEEEEDEEEEDKEEEEYFGSGRKKERSESLVSVAPFSPLHWFVWAPDPREF